MADLAELTPVVIAQRAMRQAGYVLLSPLQLAAAVRVEVADLATLAPTWNDLPRDAYLKDGGRYRSRRHSCFTYEPASGNLTFAQHRAHWQSTDYNALHGGMERWFEPIGRQVIESESFPSLLKGLGSLFASERDVARWYVEAHQFRIDTGEGIGRPTPEGAHRDGVDFVAVVLVNRRNIRGGETRVFEARGIAGVRFTMTEPWTALLLDDERVIHESTPIRAEGEGGVRDTLVVTYRSHGFQSPP
jgi:hypothetical protein